MTTQIILVAVIAVLVIYVLVLNIKIRRTKAGNGPAEVPFAPDKLLEKESTDFIFDDYGRVTVYMHYTRDEEDARRILSEGFRFADSFHHTALHVAKDQLDLKIKHNTRRLFGDYLIIICISTELVNRYTAELEKEGIRNCSFENLLTDTAPVRNENSDTIYLLNPHFIKGYINHRTGIIARNPGFDPFYDSPHFSGNIEFIRSLKN